MRLHFRARRWLAASLALLALAGLLSTLPAAHAQQWPTKPIRMIVPYSPGGPTDAIARLLATRMGTSLGQSIVVENRAGAGGTIGVDAVVKAPPDGYTLALVAPGPLAGMPNLMKTPYVLEDVQHLTLVGRIPSVLVVPAKSGIQSIEQLIERAKAEPDKLSYSSAGNGTTPHIGMELFKDQAGVRLVHVPYKGAAPAVTALLSGEVAATLVDLLPVLPHVTSGTLRVLAVAGPTRAPQLPDVPTTAEKGLPGVVMETHYGLVTAKGLPPAVQARLAESATAAVNTAEMQQQFLKLGIVPLTSTSAEYQRLMQAESAKWRSIIAKARITLD